MDLKTAIFHFVETRRSKEQVDQVLDICSSDMLLFGEKVILREMYLQNRYSLTPNWLSKVNDTLGNWCLRFLSISSHRIFKFVVSLESQLREVVRVGVFFSSWWEYLSLYKTFFLISSLLQKLGLSEDLFKPILRKDDSSSYLLRLLDNLYIGVIWHVLLLGTQHYDHESVIIKQHIVLHMRVIGKIITSLKLSYLYS